MITTELDFEDDSDPEGKVDIQPYKCNLKRFTRNQFSYNLELLLNELSPSSGYKVATTLAENIIRLNLKKKLKKK